MSQKKTLRNFWFIIGLVLVCLLINFPQKLSFKNHTFYRPEFKIGNFTLFKYKELKYGLDLAGGSSLLFNIDTSSTSSDNLDNALESLKSNIERRINLFGVSETSVQVNKQQDSYRLQVDLPGVEDINDAISLIGTTAQLSFKGEVDIAPEATATATIYDLFSKDTGINGSHLKQASVQINSNNSQPEVSLEFNQEGAELFAKATKELVGKRIAIFIDDYPVTAPTVKEEITEGKASISGSFDTNSAKELAVQLNAGALPLSISLIQQSQVGATLGQDSLNKGIFAGIIGLILVALFMIGNYGKVGIIADISLLIYALITITLYRLIPVTLTFPGIVGFILSIGMAVDSNILVFERLKEETRAGKDKNVALENAFGRAWKSIKDANACTFIVGFILFNPFNWSFLNTSGMIRGFAVTLVLGIIIGVFTSVFVTRNLLRFFTNKKLSIKANS